MIWQNIKMAILSIRSAKMRSFLTMLGVIIGVSSVLIMIAIGDGVKKEITGQISDLGTNLLTVVSGKVGTSNGFAGAASSLGTSTLTKQDAASIKELDQITDVAVMNLISGIVSANGKSSSSAIVIATDQSMSALRSLNFSSGQFFNSRQNDNKEYVAVLGGSLSKTIFGEADPVGQKIKLRNKDFTIIGVIKPTDEVSTLGGNSFDSAVYIPFKTAEKMTGSSQVFRIIARVNDADNINATKSIIESNLKENHGGQDDFSVLSQQDLVKTFSSVLDMLTSFVVAIASISLLVGGIGIMNIMLVSVSERTREIGIRKAVGATFGNILWQFLIEAVVLSLAGGAIGLAVAFLVGQLVKHLAHITPDFSVRAIVVATSISVIVGVVFGVAPAIKAAKKRPIEALKSI